VLVSLRPEGATLRGVQLESFDDFLRQILHQVETQITMMTAFYPMHRVERIAEEIRNEVSLMLAGELKDPRLAGTVMITEVRVTPDLRTVRVYVSLADEDETERASTLAGLQAAKGYVRHELVERLQLRRAPEVLFILDQSEEIGDRIDQLLRNAKSPGK